MDWIPRPRIAANAGQWHKTLRIIHSVRHRSLVVDVVELSRMPHSNFLATSPTLDPRPPLPSVPQTAYRIVRKGNPAIALVRDDILIYDSAPIPKYLWTRNVMHCLRLRMALCSSAYTARVEVSPRSSSLLGSFVFSSVVLGTEMTARR